MANPTGIGGFRKGQTGNPGGRPKTRPFREALLAEAELAAKGKPCTAPKGSLHWIARQLLERAGEETAAVRELANRTDGTPESASDLSFSFGEPGDGVPSLKVVFVTPGAQDD